MAVQQTKFTTTICTRFRSRSSKTNSSTNRCTCVATGITGISQQPGESAEGFAARQQAARAFTTRQQSLAGLAPKLQVKIQGIAQQENNKQEQNKVWFFSTIFIQSKTKHKQQQVHKHFNNLCHRINNKLLIHHFTRF